MKTLLVAFPLALLLAGAGPVLADIYSYTDSEGIVHFSNVPNDDRYKVYLKVEGPPKRFSSASKTYTGKYDTLISETSRRFGVDSDLVRAVIKAESNFNHRAVSPKGACGLMQLMPLTAQEMSVMDPFDPADNIYGGVQYLKRMLSIFKGDIPLALAAYNAGPERVIGNQIPRIDETVDYIQKVLSYFKTYKKKYGSQDNKVL